jgi:hypothetical protein
MMIVRLLSLVVLLILALIPTSAIQVLMMAEAQLVAATLVLIILIVYDVYTGFILALALIVAYFRLYGSGLTFMDGDDVRRKGPMANLVTRYITPEHLHDAQNNVVDERDFSTEMVGIKGVYGEPVYGAQGMNKGMPGFEESKTLNGLNWADLK